MNQMQLYQEVQALFKERIEMDGVVAPEWVTHDTIARHAKIDGDDKPFYVLCAYEHVRDTVRQVVRQYRPESEIENRQIVLPGYERLQVAYSVERDGESRIVRTDQCTDGELHEKADEHRTMGAGHFKHADELERYIEDRKKIQVPLTLQ